MMKLPLSAAAAGLLRALLARVGTDRDRIFLTSFRSTDWKSLTFDGERHEIDLRLTGPDAGALERRLLDGLDHAELAVPGHVVADISMAAPGRAAEDGSIVLRIEALTVAA